MKIYLHEAEMETLLVHMTEGEPIFSPDRTLGDLSQLFTEMEKRTCDILISPACAWASPQISCLGKVNWTSKEGYANGLCSCQQLIPEIPATRAVWLRGSMRVVSEN